MISVLSVVYKPHPLYGREGASQQRQTLRNRDLPILLPLKLQRDIAVIVVLAEHRGDARIVQIQRVLDSAAVVRLGLADGGVRGEFLEPDIVVMQQAILGVINKNGGGDMHCVHQA